MLCPPSCCWWLTPLTVACSFTSFHCILSLLHYAWNYSKYSSYFLVEKTSRGAFWDFRSNFTFVGHNSFWEFFYIRCKKIWDFFCFGFLMYSCELRLGTVCFIYLLLVFLPEIICSFYLIFQFQGLRLFGYSNCTQKFIFSSKTSFFISGQWLFSQN